MAAVAQGPPSKDRVAFELSSSMVAMWALVAGDLAEQEPKIGRVRAQARRAFAAREGQYRQLMADPALSAVQLGGSSPAMATLYTSDLAAQIDDSAALGLDDGMDWQIAAGQHPAVAWARCVAAYGLPPANMRNYLAMVGRPAADGSTPLLSVAKGTATRLLVEHATALADREATVWATMPPSAIGKKFDPSQTRDRNGRWESHPDAGKMAAHLNVDSNVYPDYDFLDSWEDMVNGRPTRGREEQVASRQAFEDKFGEPGKRLAVAVDDWVGYPGVSRARHVEHGTHDKNPLSRMRQRKLTGNHQILIDALNAAPATTAPLYRGASYTDVSSLQRGAVLNLPLTSFSQTPSGGERFAWLNFWDRKKTPVQFEVAPGARALNLTPLTTKGMTPNEWISNGKFKVVSAQTEPRTLHFDASDTEGKQYNVLVVKLRQVRGSSVAKAFDAQEQRDSAGRWTASGAGQTAVKERTPDLVDALFGTAPAEAPAAVATETQYAAPTQYSQATQYATQYAPATRYGTPAPEGSPTEYHSLTTYSAPQRAARELYIITGTMKQAPKPKEDTSAYGHGMFFGPVTLSDFTAGHVIDFERSAANLREKGLPAQAGLTGGKNAWVLGGKPIASIDPNRWSAVTPAAKDLWDDIMFDPMDYLPALDTTEMAEVAENAGYPHLPSKQTLLDLFHDNAEMSQGGPHQKVDKDGNVTRRYDPGLMEALADYCVWQMPEQMGSKGEEFARLLDDNGLTRAVSNLVISSVLSFPHGVGPDEDSSDMKGRYKILETNYQSGLGQFGASVPPGRVGVRDIEVDYMPPRV